MPVVVIANPKGGAGKSTLATNVAGYYASKGHTVMLGDADIQQSSRLWLGLRPPGARVISAWDIGPDQIAKPPAGTSHVVIDTPAGLHGGHLKTLLKRADKVLVPIQPSVFDIFATRAFLDELAQHRHAQGVEIGMVGMRVAARTIAAEQLAAFVQSAGFTMLGHVRDTQTYVHLAAQGLTLFDIAPARVARDLAMWEPICDWLDKP